MLSRPVPFILDENVDIAVGQYLEVRGHRVLFVARVFAAMTKDEVIAAFGNEGKAVVITGDKDFKDLVRRAPQGSRQRFRSLGRISLRCREPRAQQRIEDLIESIEFEYEQAQKRDDKRLIMQTSDTTFMVTR